MTFIQKLDLNLKKLQNIILVASCSFVTIGIGTGAILRYLFKKDLYGAEELITIAAFWMYFIGAVYATHSKKHITAELFSSFCKNLKVVYSVKILSLSVTFLLALIYSWWGWEFFHWSLFKGGKSVALLVPLVYGHSAIFIGFVLMTVYFFVQLLNEVKNFKLHLKSIEGAEV